MNRIDATHFDQLVSAWLARHSVKLKGRAIAVDGKVMRATRNHNGEQTQILSAVLHRDGISLGSVAVADKTNEIPMVQPLLAPLDIKGDVITLDAMHTQKETAEFLVKEKHADYVMTVKGNQAELLEKLERLPDESFSPNFHHVR